MLALTAFRLIDTALIRNFFDDLYLFKNKNSAQTEPIRPVNPYIGPLLYEKIYVKEKSL